MISKNSFSVSIVSNSITNSNSTTTIDNTQPLSFLDFIKNTNVDYTPEEYNNFYLFYLKQWADIKNSINTIGVSVNFVDLYVEFLKTLILNYSTQQELRFMSTLDLTDPVDLDIAIPLYVEKIRQIIIFYKEKREETKYVVDKSKIKGSSLSIEKAIFEKIYNYIVSADEQPQFSTLNLSLSTVVNEMKIDLEEFVDVYGNYFDLPRTNSEVSPLRKKEYTANTNDIDINLFFKEVLPQQVFKSTTFLAELPLAVNFAVTTDPICNPSDPLTLINANTVCGLTTADIDYLKKQLISKYIGVDFYYYSTVNGANIYDRFIVAQNPTSNILNLQTADTATVEASTELKLLRDLGLFFKPDTQGIFKLNTSNYTYTIDKTKLEPNKVYIFPDPNVYGNVSINKQPNYPLVFIHDYSKDVKNNTSGFASGDPKISNYEQTFTPYYTKQQNTEKNIVSEDSLNLNFSDLYNKGYITEVQYDVYGNEYALFKDELGHTFKSIEDLGTTSTILDLTLDGYSFFDSYEGYTFNYAITGIQSNGSIRSGLTALTVNKPTPTLSASRFTLSGSPYTLFFREFAPYQEVATTSRNVIYTFKDAGGFTFQNNTPLPDPVAADDIIYYPSPSPYYYESLIDGGISQFSPYIQRGYRSPTTSYSDFTLNAKYILSAVQSAPQILFKDYDCGYFTDDQGVLTNDNNYGDNYTYYNTVANNSLTIISTITGDNILKTQAYKRKLNGKLYVKNQRYSTSLPLSSSLNTTFNKYTSIVQSEVFNKIKDFDIIYDTIICETSSYLIFDKIKYQDGAFVTPATKNTYFTRTSSTAFNKFSNRFFNEKDRTITFCVINQITQNGGDNIATEGDDYITTEEIPAQILQSEFNCLSGSNFKILLPTIYRYDIVDNSVLQVFPLLSDIQNTATALFSLRGYITSTFNINIVKVDKPIITFNSFNNMYKLSYTSTDSNNMFYVFDYSFNINDNAVTFYDAKFYKTDKIVNTTGFYSSSISYAVTGSIQGSLTAQDGALIL